jgi:Flp pilus assembly protein TadG
MKKNSERNSRSSRRNGAVLVEAALVLPLFFMVLLGIVEFGRAMMVSQLLTTAARDAGRSAIMDGSTNMEVTTTVKDFLQSTVGVAPQDVSVRITVRPGGTLANASPGATCAILIDVAFDKVSFIPGDYLGGQRLQGRCTMRHL